MVTKTWKKRVNYSVQFKKKIIRQVIEDGYTPLEVSRRHDIGKTSIYRWLDKFGEEINDNFELNQVKEPMSSPTKKEPNNEEQESTNTSRIEELEEELRIERLKRKAYQQMIKIAEERFKISIKKKYGTKQFNK